MEIYNQNQMNVECVHSVNIKQIYEKNYYVNCCEL